MPLYKQVLLTNLKSTPNDVARVFQECAALVTSKGGVIRATENRGEKRLGYGIEDRRWGALQRHYEGKLIVQQFNTSPAVLKEVEAKLKNSFPIIRFQTFKVRDPVDKLMNTRMTLEQAQLLLNPAAKAKIEQAAKDKAAQAAKAKIQARERFEQAAEDFKEGRRPRDLEDLDIDPEELTSEEIENMSPEDLLDMDDEVEAAQFKQYVPEWKRDALFEPDVPAHLKDPKH